ncbi:MAG: hypothetical protein IBJ14_08590 [Hydrogenophaga sp.]|nr:hypothetical protein [Hydrogenophaga sp.]
MEPNPHLHGRRRLTGLLWAINLASISASVLVYLYLAHHAYRVLDSLLVSEFVLLAPMVMPVVFAFQLHQVASRVDPRRLLWVSNVLGALVCTVLFLLVDLTATAVLVGAALVGTLDAVQRVARIVAIKRFFSASEVRFTVPLTLTAQFIAGAMAGAILAFFPGRLTHASAAIATISLMGLAAACAVLLPRLAEQRAAAPADQAGLRRCVGLLRDTPALRESLFAFVLLGAVFQGFYNLSRVALPAHHLGLGQSQVGLLQIVASLSAVAGALTYYALSRRHWAFRLGWIYPLSAIAMVGACVLPGVPASFTSYFIYFFCFELAFFRLQGDIMLATPANDMPLVATLQYALVYAGMMLAIAIGAVLIETHGLTATALAFVLFFFLCTALRRQRGAATASTHIP